LVGENKSIKNTFSTPKEATAKKKGDELENVFRLENQNGGLEGMGTQCRIST